ncbi:MAG: SGNH/GDSL hydrolase family protein [Candidatus Spyradenecus sp.]
MKRFVLCVALFAAVVVTLAVPLFLWAYRSQVRLFKQALVVPDCRVAGVGDSRMKTSIDPALWSGFGNFGQDAGPIAVSLLKARTLCASNPNLEVILIDIWPKPGFFAHETFEYNLTPCYILAELMDGRWHAARRTGALQRFKSGVVAAAIENLRAEKPTSWLRGGYGALHQEATKNRWRDEAAFVKLAQAERAPKAAPLPEMGEGERELRAFLESLRGRSVRAVLLTTPIHPWYRKYIYGGNDREARFEARMKAISAEFDVPWLNHWADPRLTDPDLLADGTHLNWRGSRLYTQIVQEEVEALQRQWQHAPSQKPH